MDNHLSIFENTNGSIYPNDLFLNIIEESNSSLSPPKSNETLSPSSSNQSLDLPSTTSLSFPCCIFTSKPNSHPFQERRIPLDEHVKIGRAVARLKALSDNAIFDCKVLSRQHAKLWHENGKFFLQDTKSSNGTFVNNQRLGKCNEDSEPYEIFSGDIVQFGVDVTENNRKTTHNCIILEVRLFHTDGNEALSRSSNNSSFGQLNELDVNSQILYQLAQYLQEAMHREQGLEQKLEHLRCVLREAQQSSDDSWQAIIHEDRLLGRINALEDQIGIYRTKHINEETIKQEIIQLKESQQKFEEELKIKLEKVLLERTEAINRNQTLESSLKSTQDGLKHLETQNEQFKYEIQNTIESIDEQRLLIEQFERNLQDSHTRCTDLENEKQRIQNQFEEYYQRTHHLEGLQNGLEHHELEVQSSLKDSIAENGEMENHHPPVVGSTDVIGNDHHTSNGIDSQKEFLEAQERLLILRDDLNNVNERLASTEDSYRSEQERYRTLTSDYQTLEDELTRLKLRVNKDKNDNEDLVKDQQSELTHLSKSIRSKQTEHDQLLTVYICFFLSCYLLIFFLFFFLLPW